MLPNDIFILQTLKKELIGKMQLCNLKQQHNEKNHKLFEKRSNLRTLHFEIYQISEAVRKE